MTSTSLEMSLLNERLDRLDKRLRVVDRGRQLALFIAAMAIIVGVAALWSTRVNREIAQDLRENRFESIQNTCETYNRLLDTVIVMTTESARAGILTFAGDPENLTEEERAALTEYLAARTLANERIAERSRLDCSRDEIEERNGFPSNP